MIKKFKDLEHDTDSCKDVWEEFYNLVYQDFFGKYFEFSKLEDKETSNPKRWYIKLRDDINAKNDYPKFKMAGDCVFNFNNKKVSAIEKLPGWSEATEEEKELLKKCMEHHHSFANFAFMPITGNMQGQKGSHQMDRPDIHINAIKNYFQKNKSNENEDEDIDQCSIFSHASKNNQDALKWYLSLFDNDIHKYFKEVYLIDDERYIENEFLKYIDMEIKDRATIVQYMKLAIDFWEKRKEWIVKIMCIDVNYCYLDDALGYEFKPEEYTGNEEDYKDPDACSDRLYKDLLKVMRWQDKKDNLFSFDEYSEGKYYLNLKAKKCNYELAFTLTSDFIGVNRKFAADVGISLKEIGEYLKLQHTIGGHMLFPKGKGYTINQAKGNNMLDRIDFTLAEVKEYYRHICSENREKKYMPHFRKPLGKSIERYYEWLKIFISDKNDGEKAFKNFIDFLILNPFVTESYEVKSLVTENIINTNTTEAFFPGLDSFRSRVQINSIRKNLRNDEETRRECQKAFRNYIEKTSHAIKERNDLIAKLQKKMLSRWGLLN